MLVYQRVRPSVYGFKSHLRWSTPTFWFRSSLRPWVNWFYWLLLPPFHLSKNHPNPDASRFSSAHFFQVFFFQWFSNHFQHVLRPRKEHSGGLWLTNLCSQKCLWAMGSPQHGRRVVPPLGLLLSENRGAPKWMVYGWNIILNLVYFLWMKPIFPIFYGWIWGLTWHQHFRESPESFRSLGKSSRNGGFSHWGLCPEIGIRWPCEGQTFQDLWFLRSHVWEIGIICTYPYIYTIPSGYD